MNVIINWNSMEECTNYLVEMSEGDFKEISPANGCYLAYSPNLESKKAIIKILLGLKRTKTKELIGLAKYQDIERSWICKWATVKKVDSDHFKHLKDTHKLIMSGLHGFFEVADNVSNTPTHFDA
jgi:hypothetical protein